MLAGWPAAESDGALDQMALRIILDYVKIGRMQALSVALLSDRSNGGAWFRCCVRGTRDGEASSSLTTRTCNNSLAYRPTVE